jgi:hypothetical protein
MIPFLNGARVWLAAGHAQLCGVHDYAESAAIGGISPLFGNRLALAARLSARHNFRSLSVPWWH